MAAKDRAPGRNEGRDDGVSAFAARPGSLADRFAGRVGRQHPVTVFFAALLSGFALLAAVAILLGLFVTDVLVPIHAVGSADEGFVESLAADRTPVLTDESATYRVSSLVVPRERPSVHRLEDLPADASYPSGHTAASIAVYAGLVLLLTSKITDRRARMAAWALAVLLPVLVAMSRMYRGMHHPLDVASGVVVGIGAIAVVLFACRSASCAQRSPAAERTPARAGRARTA